MGLVFTELGQLSGQLQYFSMNMLVVEIQCALGGAFNTDIGNLQSLAK